jgi:hypothetical protein
MTLGVGTELKQLIRKMGIRPTESCNCESRALIMDSEGPGWCRSNLKTIVDWLAEEAANRSMPFNRTVAKLLVLRAIHNFYRKARMLQITATDPVHQLASTFEFSPLR